jgi:hypothetical protein
MFCFGDGTAHSLQQRRSEPSGAIASNLRRDRTRGKGGQTALDVLLTRARSSGRLDGEGRRGGGACDRPGGGEDEAAAVANGGRPQGGEAGAQRRRRRRHRPCHQRLRLFACCTSTALLWRPKRFGSKAIWFGGGRLRACLLRPATAMRDGARSGECEAKASRPVVRYPLGRAAPTQLEPPGHRSRSVSAAVRPPRAFRQVFLVGGGRAQRPRRFRRHPTTRLPPVAARPGPVPPPARVETHP